MLYWFCYCYSMKLFSHYIRNKTKNKIIIFETHISYFLICRKKEEILNDYLMMLIGIFNFFDINNTHFFIINILLTHLEKRNKSKLYLL